MYIFAEKAYHRVKLEKNMEGVVTELCVIHVKYGNQILRRNFTPGPEVIKLFSCSAPLSLKFILLINVKMPTIVGILTFISRINYRLWQSYPEISTNFGYFSNFEQFKFHAQLS